MRRTSAITLARRDRACPDRVRLWTGGRRRGRRRQTGEAVSTGAATGTITVWAMGAEGEKLPALAKEFESRQPRRQGPGHRHPVGCGPRQVHHRHHGQQDARRRHGRYDVDGRVRRHGRPRPDPRRRSTSRCSSRAPRRPPRWTGRRTASPGTSRRAWSTTAPTSPRRPASRRPPTDWDGLKSMAKAMQDKAGAKWGIGLQAGGTGSWQSVMPFAWSAGADLTKDGGKAYNFDSPEVLKAARVLPVVLHRRHLRQGSPGDADDRAGLRQRQGADVHLRPVDDVRGREGRWRRGVQGEVRRHADPRRQDLLVVRRRLEPRRSSRTPRTATPRGSSSSGSPTPRPR